MKIKNNGSLIVILIIVLAVGSFYYINLEKEGSGLKIHYYKDGVEVFQSNTLSVIRIDTSSYDEISFEIIGKNTGDYPISNMVVANAGPIEFKDSLPTLPKFLEVGETKTLWISDRIDVHQFESLSQPIKFWVNISGESPYVSGKIYDYIDLDINFGTLEYNYVEEQLESDVSVGLWYGILVGQQKTIINNKINKIGIKLTNPNGIQTDYDATIKIISVDDNTIIDEAPIQNLNVITSIQDGDWYYAFFDNPPLINERVTVIIDFAENQLPDYGTNGQTIFIKAISDYIDGEMMNAHFINSFVFNGYSNLFDMMGWDSRIISNEALDMTYQITYDMPKQSPLTVSNQEDFTDVYYTDLTHIRYDIGVSGIQPVSCYAQAIGAYDDPYTGPRDLYLSCIVSQGKIIVDSNLNRMVEGEHIVTISVHDNFGATWETNSILKIDKSSPIITLQNDFNSMVECNNGIFESLDLEAYVSDSISGINEGTLKFKIFDFPSGAYDSGWLPMQYSGIDGIYEATLTPGLPSSCQLWMQISVEDNTGNLGVL